MKYLKVRAAALKDHGCGLEMGSSRNTINLTLKRNQQQQKKQLIQNTLLNFVNLYLPVYEGVNQVNCLVSLGMTNFS